MDFEDRYGLSSQVHIPYYASQNDFIVTIACNDPIDQVILAKIPRPGKTLLETVDSVTGHLQYRGGEPEGRDLLVAPVINFDIMHYYPELSGKIIYVWKDGKRTDAGNLVDVK